MVNKKLISLSLLSLLLVACNQNTEETPNQPTAEEENTDESQTASARDEESREIEYEINNNTWEVEPLEGSDANENVVLLTFDDAPYGNSLDIADTLEENDASAIFFVNSMYMEDDEGKQVVKELYDRGFEIGNHTHTHANLQTISEDQQYDEIITTNDMVEEITGSRPRFFRAPHGANTEYSNQLALEEGMQVMNWTYGYDWVAEYTEPEPLADIMVNTPLLSSGGNLLMHDREWTAEALPAIMDGISEQGYEFVDPKQIASPGLESEDN